MTWFVIPSKRPPAEAQECVNAWKAMGYSVALLRDPGDGGVDADLVLHEEYPGYGKAVNILAKIVLRIDLGCDWVVTGGDDVFPDTTKRAEVIAAECSEHFEVIDYDPEGRKRLISDTFGVMQPTGGGHGIEAICGSPWLGREWCERAHKGAGPMHPEFWHMFVDSALQGAAKAVGVLWQRSDLKHDHRHWTWTSHKMPRFLAEANSPAHWQQAEQLYKRLQRSGFAECFPA